MVMVVKEPMPVVRKIPDDEDVDDRYDEDGPRKFRPTDQFVNFDGYKKGRLDDGRPAGPTHAKNQAHSFDQ